MTRKEENDPLIVDFSKIDLREPPVLILKNIDGAEIQTLGYATNVTPELHFNEISQITFDLPAVVDGVRTPHYDDVVGMRLIDLAGVGQFKLVDPTENKDGAKTIKSCKAYSLEYEFVEKKIALEEDTYELTDGLAENDTILGIILEKLPSWRKGAVSPALVGKYRTFDTSSQSVYDFMKSTLQEKFRCVFDFDTYTRTVNVIDVDDFVPTRSVFLSMDNLLKSVEVQENSDNTGVGTDNDARRRNEAVWTREITYLNTYAGATFCEKTMNFLLSCGITLEKINAFRAAMIDGTPAALTANIASYTVTKTLNSAEVDNSAASAKQYQPFTAKVTPASGKVLSSIQVTMGGVDITNSAFKGTTDVLRRSITKNLTECKSSNTRIFAIDGQSYVTTLSANIGYEIDSVTITMGGVDVSTYYKGGIVSIPEVTGDIVITATAVAQGPAYTNQLANAIDMSGNIIGKTAMYTDKRYSSSSGDPVDNQGTLITGLVPCGVGDTIRIRWTGKNDGTYQQVKAFKSDRTQCATGYASFDRIANGTVGASLIQEDLENGILDFKIGSNNVFNGMAYLAIVLIEEDINNVIVTVNEEIV